ncbi:PAS domain S-box protein [Kaarinaea lacus]
MLPLITRFVLFFTVNAAGVLFVLISLEYQKFNLEKSRYQTEEALRLSLTLRDLQADLMEPVRDINTISALQVLRDFAGNRNPAHRIRVEQEFLNFAKQNEIYAQIRFIDPSGKEQVRVDYDSNMATVVPQDQLQDKSKRYYIRESMQLKANAIYISPLDLNIEQGQIEQPFKPMIRFVTPVFNADNQRQGVIVLNYLATTLLEDFREFMTDSWGEPMIVNSGGYWLFSSNSDEEWGFMLGNDKTFAKRYADAWDYIVGQESGSVETEEGLFIFYTLQPYTAVAAHGTTPATEFVTNESWKIISRVSPQSLIYEPASLFKIQNGTLAGLLFLVIVLSAVLTWQRTKYVTKVSALSESEKRLAEAQRIAHVGNWVWDIPADRLYWSDEIYRIFGRDPGQSDASYEEFITAIHPDDREKVKHAVDAAIHDNASYTIDHRIVLPGGGVRYVHERGAVQRDTAGEPIRMLGTVHDISDRVQAEELLREKEERFRQLADNIEEVFWLTEWPDNRVLYVSPAFEHVWGFTPDQIYKDPMIWADTISNEYREQVEQVFMESASKGGFDVTYQIKRPNGESRWIHDRAFVVRNEQGEVFRIAGVAQDITERKQLEYALRGSEEQLRELVQQASDGIFIANIDGQYIDVNIAGCKLLGYSREEIIGKTILDIIVPDETDRLLKSKEQLLKGRTHVAEWNLQRKDGAILPVEVSAKILPDGRWQGIVRDISERKQIEEQLHNYREQLEEMVAQRTAALETSYKEMEAFSYSIAHDLRTPLRTITSFSQILEEEAGPKLSENEREDLQRVINAGKYMSQLIDDILGLARISRAEFKEETVDLSGMAQTILDNLRQIHPQRNVQVDISPDIQCRGDSQLLRTAMENLLGNAWKYTGKRTDAHIQFGFMNQNGKKVYYVRDNGAGFDMQYIHKLFTPFGRLHSYDDFEGAGIGLASAQSAIQRHSGKIWAESSPGKGATFYFTLHTFTQKQA